VFKHTNNELSYYNEDKPFISLNGVKKSYCSSAGEFQVLRGINLDIKSGEFISIVGKSGSGKTTLINMIAGIDHPTCGEIKVGNTTIHNLSEGKMAVWRGRNIGIVFQFFQLLPMLSLIENVILPMDFISMYNLRQRKERALHLLDLVGLADQAYKLPSAVSGGQQQRAAIARALANDPPLILADEPTGNLDSKTTESVFMLFEQLISLGKTLIIVTHDTGIADRSNRSVVISDGEIFNGENKKISQEVKNDKLTMA